MSRPSVMTGYHAYGHGHRHAHAGHYGVPAVSHYDLLGHSGPPFARQRPMRAPVLAPAGFNHQHTGQHQHPISHGRIANLTMADPAYMATDEELAHLQKLSSEYEPEATGPLVGERQSSAAITAQYATADPVYRAKTAALPAKYAYYRTCRGDGHCGWRAVAFTYFEALLRVGDVHKFQDEEARLMSMGNLLEQVGYQRDIWMDFAEPAFELLQKLAISLQDMDGAAADILLQAFNDMNQAMGIITFVKLLASAWLQTHPDEYSHYVPMGNLKLYCGNNIEPSQCELDNIGLAALGEALVKPAGFGLEVWYLDRSPGEEINRSFFVEPTDHHHMAIPNAPMLRLLYRPGHYDILYKAGDFPQPMHQQLVPSQPALQVSLVNYTDDFVPSASNVADVLTMIPGMGPSGFGQQWPSLGYDFRPSPVSRSQAPVPYSPAPIPAAPVSSSHLEFNIPMHSEQASHYNPVRHHSIHLDQPPVTLPMHPPPPPVSIERATPSTVERGGPFRPSMYELEPGFGSALQQQSFQTSIFRNSPFNTAHFMNPEFQPDQWSPGGEHATCNKGRHKSQSS